MRSIITTLILVFGMAAFSLALPIPAAEPGVFNPCGIYFKGALVNCQKPKPKPKPKHHARGAN
ncbi:hypothetical protein FRB94_003058 [Tulasnella sp. JGI-2019a]|nr:hypothetical protein FRB94_003058 [Tulasnella sp. JGI-2019a]KAG9005309.1 hypothetical protein FRB93_009863 [Tulasnella sp. JGI-2019a]KAG9027610.1 hypothetical protein FRB95_007572 [Tulasnella sp. JGI-2019a]